MAETSISRVSRYNRYASLGICVDCKKPRDNPQHKLCVGCTLKRKEYTFDKVYVRKLCSKCPNPRDSSLTTCKSCTALSSIYSKKKRQVRIDQGLCAQCSTPIVKNKSHLCACCMLKQMSKKALDTPKHWVLIKELLEKQNYLCAYTGEKLILGENASIDHIIPKARGGENKIENLQWTTLEVNLAKRDLTHEEFLNMCHSVTTTHPKFEAS